MNCLRRMNLCQLCRKNMAFVTSCLSKRKLSRKRTFCSPVAAKCSEFASLCTTSSSSSNQLVNEFSYRTHNCGELRLSDQGKQVTVCGWVQFQRMGKFITLRDAYGVIQLIVPDTPETNLDPEHFAKLTLESVVRATGVVQPRPEDQENKKMATGDIEIALTDLKVLSYCKPKLPYQIRDFQKVHEPTRLKYRYLDLRNKELQRNLRLRSEVVTRMREFFYRHKFVEVETPTLFKKTPGGAQEFVVPTRYPGKYFNLVQSPQQFKQLLMVGGLDRYFQVARCYRDEGTKPERQPEFTQIDLEVSFTTMDDVMSLVERLMKYSWPENEGQFNIPFPRMTYDEAMSSYGTDKPDIRFDMKLRDVTHIFREMEPQKLERLNKANCFAFAIPGGSEKLKKDLRRLKKEFKVTCKNLAFEGKLIGAESTDGLEGNENWNGLRSETKDELRKALFPLEPGDYLWLAFGERRKARSVLGRVRVECARCLDKQGVAVYETGWPSFLWVHAFPLFLPAEDDDGASSALSGGNDAGRIESGHHPFTAPLDEHVQRLYTDPLSVIGQHFDLVLNGEEVGGGSIRINDASLQRHVLENILGEDVSKMHYFLEALESGCPPHGGLALGLDRLLAIICRANSIRDVIAFPKSSDCKDLMSEAPSDIDHKTKTLYHLNPAAAGAGQERSGGDGGADQKQDLQKINLESQ